MKAWLAAFVMALVLPAAVSAHETTRSYVTVTRDGAAVTAQARIAFRDIEVAVWIDEDLDGILTWGETRRRIDALSAYVLGALALEAGGLCDMARTAAGASSEAGVDYLDLSFAGRCPDAAVPLTATSTLFAEIDPHHRVFLTATTGGVTKAAVLSKAGNSAVLSGDTATPGGFGSYFTEGMRHFLGGADHLVFLLLLILPAIATGAGLRRSVMGVVAAVTGFTLAHALTLTAATTALLRPPTAVIEILIALSIIATGFDNLRPFIPVPRAAVAAFFGLIHGFGFATALGALQMGSAGFVTALIGFNLGIEFAQIGVVLVALPALFMLGHGKVLMQAGSLAAVGLGVYWTWIRLPLM